MRYVWAGLTVGMLAFASSAVAQADSFATEMHRAWAQAYNEGDTETLAGMYSEGFALLPPNGQKITEVPAMVALVQAYKDAGAVEIDTKAVEDSGVMGETAWAHGNYTLFASDGTAVDHGKFLIVYVQEDGDWKIHRHMWNSDLPPPPASG